jgi:hypothetical protein
MAHKDKDDKYWVDGRYRTDGLNYASIERAIEILQAALAEQQAGKWKDLMIELREEYGDPVVAITGMRPETDKERVKREAEEKQQAIRGEKWERQQYEALKKKFEPAAE